MEAVVGSMGAMVGSMGGDVVGSMMRAFVCLMGRWPGGLMESSRERIIGLVEAVVGLMIGRLMAAEKQSSVEQSTAS
jgi:hypothetical protein